MGDCFGAGESDSIHNSENEHRKWEAPNKQL